MRFRGPKTHLDVARLREEQLAFFQLGKTHLGSRRLREDYGKPAEEEEEEKKEEEEVQKATGRQREDFRGSLQEACRRGRRGGGRGKEKEKYRKTSEGAYRKPAEEEEEKERKRKSPGKPRRCS